MNQYTQLLSQGAKEMRNYCLTSEGVDALWKTWLDRLAERMEAAGRLEDKLEVEDAIYAIAHSIMDSGPNSTEAAPSFSVALDALQRDRKRKRKHANAKSDL